MLYSKYVAIFKFSIKNVKFDKSVKISFGINSSNIRYSF